MRFWEALFAICLAAGGVPFALFRRVPATPVAVALLLGGIAVLGAAFLLIESGEVVVLRTSGGELLARLWVVDHDGDPWIGKMDPSEARWVERLRAEETAQLVRGGRAQCRRPVFVEDAKVRMELFSLFMEKYDTPLYGARLLGFLFGGDPDPMQAAESAVLVRLEPCLPAR